LKRGKWAKWGKGRIARTKEREKELPISASGAQLGDGMEKRSKIRAFTTRRKKKNVGKKCLNRAKRWGPPRSSQRRG